MNVKDLNPAGVQRRYLPLLLVLFACSGCSALIYEIVWYQVLQLVIGSTAVSLGVLLATFMGGLCLGSLLLPRMARARDMHPLRVYGLVELGIGACGILVLILMPLMDSIYVAAVGHGLPAILFRALIAGICLLPPTFLMGASLPAAARYIESSPRGVSWLGFLYGGNTAGAVFGCLLAGFYLLRVYNLTTATLVAAAINAVVGLVSLGLAKRTPEAAPAPQAKGSVAAARFGPWPIYVTIAISGSTALGAEVVWTRLLGLLLGATVYTFSIILAVFLIGIGLGSAAAAAALRGEAVQPRVAIGWCQMLLAGGGGLDRLDALRVRCPTGPLTRCSPPTPDSLFKSTWPAPVDRAAGHAPVGRQFSPGAGRGGFAKCDDQGAWWAESMPPIPAAPLWARWPSAWC
jgi:spermidine synthase